MADIKIEQLEQDRIALEAIRNQGGGGRILPEQIADEGLKDRLLEYKKEVWADETLSGNYIESLNQRNDASVPMVDATATDDEKKAQIAAVQSVLGVEPTGVMNQETIDAIKKDKRDYWVDASYTANIGAHMEQHIARSKEAVRELDVQPADPAPAQAQPAAPTVEEQLALMMEMLRKQNEALEAMRTEVKETKEALAEARKENEALRTQLQAKAEESTLSAATSESVVRDANLSARIDEEAIVRQEGDTTALQAVRRERNQRQRQDRETREEIAQTNEGVKQNADAIEAETAARTSQQEQNAARMQVTEQNVTTLRTDTDTLRRDTDTLRVDLTTEQGDRTKAQQQTNAALAANTAVDVAQTELLSDHDHHLERHTTKLIQNDRVDSRQSQRLDALEARTKAEDQFYEQTTTLVAAQKKLEALGEEFVAPPTSEFSTKDVKDENARLYSEVHKMSKDQRIDFTKGPNGMVASHITTKGTEYQLGYVQNRRGCYCQCWIPTETDRDGLIYLPKVNQNQTIQMDKGDVVMLDANSFADGQKVNFDQKKNDRGELVLLVEEGAKLDIRQEKDKVIMTLNGKTTELTGVELSEIQIAAGKHGQAMTSDKMMSAEQYVQDRKTFVDGKKSEWDRAKDAATQGLHEEARKLVQFSDLDGDKKISAAEEGRLNNVQDLNKVALAAVGAARQKFGDDAMKPSDDGSGTVVAPQTQTDPATVTTPSR